MGRIPTWAVILIGVFLLVGTGVLVFMLMIKPARESLADAEQKLEEEKQVASRLDTAEAELEDVTDKWLEAQEKLQDLREARSIPISFGHPAGAMIALWYEYRHDVVPLIEDWVQSSGCTIESGASFPAPPMTPPSAPPSGFMQIPEGQTIQLTVSGTLTEIERLYRSLDQFERVVTISDLVLAPVEAGSDLLQAQIALKFYLLVEAPPSAAPAAAAGGAGAGMQGAGAPGMPGGGGSPGMPGEGAPPGEGPPGMTPDGADGAPRAEVPE
jgi:Tfp pilus assembly protein PilO